MSIINEVAKFMELGEQKFPESPTAILNWDELEGIVDKMGEEVAETSEALLYHVRGDKPNAARMIDGAIDTAYVALSLAIKIAGVEERRELGMKYPRLTYPRWMVPTAQRLLTKTVW